MNVFGIKADCFQNPQGLRQNLISNAIPRHSHNRMFRHQLGIS